MARRRRITIKEGEEGKERRRKRLSVSGVIGTWFVVGVILGMVAAYAVNRPQWALSEIVVKGDWSLADINWENLLVTIAEPTTLWRLKLDSLLQGRRLEEKILNRVPYARRIRVEEIWPSKILIEVEMDSPVFAVVYEGKTWILSSRGKIVGKRDSLPFDMPVIELVGIRFEELGAVFSKLKELKRALSECGVGGWRGVLSDRGLEIKVGKTTIFFGEVNDRFADKIGALQAIIRYVTQRSDIEVTQVDLRGEKFIWIQKTGKR